MNGQRLFVAGASIAVLGIFGFVLWNGLGENSVYYLEPSEALERRAEFADGDPLRLGGLVVVGSLQDTSDGIRFAVWDGAARITVETSSTPPPLFQEDVGVILDGSWNGDLFVADQLLLRHDEQYAVPEDYEPGS